MPSFKCSDIMISGILLAHDAKQRPMEKQNSATAMLMRFLDGDLLHWHQP